MSFQDQGAESTQPPTSSCAVADATARSPDALLARCKALEEESARLRHALNRIVLLHSPTGQSALYSGEGTNPLDIARAALAANQEQA